MNAKQETRVNRTAAETWLRGGARLYARKVTDEQGRWWMFEGEARTSGIDGPFFYCEDDDEPFRESLPEGEYVRGKENSKLVRRLDAMLIEAHNENDRLRRELVNALPAQVNKRAQAAELRIAELEAGLTAAPTATEAQRVEDLEELCRRVLRADGRDVGPRGYHDVSAALEVAGRWDKEAHKVYQERIGGLVAECDKARAELETALKTREVMGAFITGSHAYGAPTEQSDVDLVVRVDEDEAEKLVELLGEPENTLEHPDGYTTLALRCGKLNIIFCISDARYDSWRQGTKLLKGFEEAPTRELAVALFKALFSQDGAS